MTLTRTSSVVLVLGAVLLVTVGLWHAVTGQAAGAAQQAMAEEWAQQVTSPAAAGRADGAGPADDGSPPMPASSDAAPAADLAGPGATGQPAGYPAVALLEVQRPGAGPLLGGALFVGEGVDPDQLDRGPGHFPGSALPGQEGNFAVAGHRTTHGGPFGDLGGLRPDDEIHVTDRTGQRFLYRVVEQRIVKPTDTWVVGPDPLGRGRPMLTLTTCHPRYSARQRLVVWAELA